MISPLYQVQLLPGIREISVGVIPPGRLVAHWSIDIPSPVEQPQGKVSVVQEFGSIGRIDLGEWALTPAVSLDRSPPLVPFLLPYGSKLIIETAGYSISRLTLYGYGVPDPYQLIDPSNMAVNYAPYIPPLATSETIATIPASTSAVAVAANPDRLGGYIVNKANRSMWIKWGVLSSSSPFTAALPFTEVPKDGNISIDPGYTGAIGLIWSSGVNTTQNAYVHELIA